MFNKLKILTIILLSFNLIACGGGSDGTTDNNGATNNPDNGSGEVATSYGGTYKGDFTGIETGSWEITVNTNGSVTGSATTTSLPITTYPLTGLVDASGNSTLVSGSSASDVTFTLSIANGIVSGSWISSAGGGGVSGIVISTGAVSGVLSVSGDFGNKSFRPLNVNELAIGSVVLIAFDNLPGGVIQTDPGFDDHLITLYIDPTTNLLVAVGYSFFNPAPVGIVPDGYVYRRDCFDSPCPSISFDITKREVVFTNTELRVDLTDIGGFGGNVAMTPMTVNGTLNW